MPTIRSILKDQGYTNNAIKTLLKSGKIWFMDAPTSDGGRIIDEISQIHIKEHTPKMTVGRDPIIVHKEPHFVIVYKPTNYLAVPARGRQGEHSILSFVRMVIGEGHAVHRLDEGTSGLMMVATTEYGQEKLKELLEQRLIKRNYLCIVKTKKKEAFDIESHLIRNRGDGRRGSWEKYGKKTPTTDDEPPTPPEDSKWSRSYFTPHKKAKGLAIFGVALDTGRTHQIRIHGAENGCPIIGDTLYAPQGLQRMLERLALHSHHIAFTHFDTGEELSWTAPLADDLELFWRQYIHESSDTKPLKKKRSSYKKFDSSKSSSKKKQKKKAKKRRK
jgi:23S rRNA-/tRNA-specific pseudouridylate synthase